MDSVVYDLSKFSSIHPGGQSVLLDDEIGNQPNLHIHTEPLNFDHFCRVAGKDATEAFYSLHRQEVLEKSQYARLCIGTVEGSAVGIKRVDRESLSEVPYAEPTWLRKGYHSPYYSDVSVNYAF